MTTFDDIRPFNDVEVAPALARLLRDHDFLDAILKFKRPLLASLFGALARPLVRWRLARELDGVQTVADFQAKIESYLARVIETTTEGLSVSGLEHLTPSQPYLFISNHRDIAMDPAFVNWVLYQNGFQTLRIAIGDNLLKNRAASDLMRLNKSFIVNRSATAPREKLKAAKHLSAYIHHALMQDSANIWIAQREGRAKDGRDLTNPAIISMLLLAKPKEQTASEYLTQLRIVPVSLSYEWDPCDSAKARELTMVDESGRYEKTEHEDVQSIVRGITGQKGRVHVAFGQPLVGDLSSADRVAEVLDKAIATLYVQHPTNAYAYQLLTGKAPRIAVGPELKLFDAEAGARVQTAFDARLQQCPSAYRERFLQGYANPVFAALAASSHAG